MNSQILKQCLILKCLTLYCTHSILEDKRKTIENLSRSVRHLCDEYWKELTDYTLDKVVNSEIKYIDLEVTVRKKHGPLSWDVSVNNSNIVKRGSDLLVRTNKIDYDFQPNDLVRILNSRLISSAEDSYHLPIVELNTFSEAFQVVLDN